MKFGLCRQAGDLPAGCAQLCEVWDYCSWEDLQKSFQTGQYLLFFAEEGELASVLLAFLSDDGADVAYLFTTPKFRRHKLALSLLKNLEAELLAGDSDKKIFLEVAVKNVAARRLYDGFGMRVVNTRKKYYKDGGDALVYSKEVS
jgi:ribosomal-protein-alanine N-acetyltransferase